MPSAGNLARARPPRRRCPAAVVPDRARDTAPGAAWREREPWTSLVPSSGPAPRSPERSCRQTPLFPRAAHKTARIQTTKYPSACRLACRSPVLDSCMRRCQESTPTLCGRRPPSVGAIALGVMLRRPIVCKTEIQHLYRAVGADLHIRRLQIAMHDAVFVSGFDGLRNLRRNKQHLGQWERATGVSLRGS